MRRISALGAYADAILVEGQRAFMKERLGTEIRILPAFATDCEDLEASVGKRCTAPGSRAFNRGRASPA